MQKFMFMKTLNYFAIPESLHHFVVPEKLQQNVWQYLLWLLCIMQCIQVFAYMFACLCVFVKCVAVWAGMSWRKCISECNCICMRGFKGRPWFRNLTTVSSLGLKVNKRISVQTYHTCIHVREKRTSHHKQLWRHTYAHISTHIHWHTYCVSYRRS